MSFVKAFYSGLAGAVSLTVLHETARRFLPDAPRMDILGMRAIAKSLRKSGHTPPDDPELHRAALVGDLISNTAYYSLVGFASPANTVKAGAGLGLAAGLGAVFLPPVLGLGDKPSRRTTTTAVLSVLWYLVGGLAAAAVAQKQADHPA